MINFHTLVINTGSSSPLLRENPFLFFYSAVENNFENVKNELTQVSKRHARFTDGRSTETERL
jgi:hypothetical protein